MQEKDYAAAPPGEEEAATRLRALHAACAKAVAYKAARDLAATLVPPQEPTHNGCREAMTQTNTCALVPRSPRPKHLAYCPSLSHLHTHSTIYRPPPSFSLSRVSRSYNSKLMRGRQLPSAYTLAQTMWDTGRVPLRAALEAGSTPIDVADAATAYDRVTGTSGGSGAGDHAGDGAGARAGARAGDSGANGSGVAAAGDGGAAAGGRGVGERRRRNGGHDRGRGGGRGQGGGRGCSRTRGRRDEDADRSDGDGDRYMDDFNAHVLRTEAAASGGGGG